MEQELIFHIILEKAPTGVDYALAKGKGNNHTLIQKQRAGSADLYFEFPVTIKKSKDAEPEFYGPFVQGPTGERFVYINIGTAAGQADSPWSRRLKVPLRGITWQLIDKATGSSLTTHVAGTAKDGSPTCATVKPFAGWIVTSGT